MIDLTAIPMDAPEPRFIDYGADQEPAFGGVATRVDFFGGKHALDVKTPPMPGEPDGRLWISRLKRAKKQGARLAFPQPGFKSGSPGSPVVAANLVGGTSIPLSGLTPGYTIREGQWLSVIHGGRSYLYSVDAAINANGSGAVTVTVSPMLRSILSIGDVVNLLAPVIEGYIAGNEQGWTISNAEHVGLAFTVMERG